jgi:uncharacterized RDD family membrane protein YckC
MVAPTPSPPSSSLAQGADPTAVFGRRVLAFLIDSALILVPTLLALSASFEYLDESRIQGDPAAFCEDYMDDVGGLCVDLADVNDRVYFSEGTDAASTLIFWGGSLLLLVVLQGMTGWTVGKLVTGIRTVREDGRPPGLGRALGRWILLVVDMFPCVGLVGLITAGTSTGHRRVGDMAVKTFVVRSQAAGAPIRVPGMATSAAAGYGDTWSQPSPPPGAAWGPSPTASPSSWDQPVAPAPSQWDQGPAATSAPAAPGGPQWDDARGTYIQWDPAQGRWLQWDEANRRWDVIPGQ